MPRKPPPECPNCWSWDTIRVTDYRGRPLRTRPKVWTCRECCTMFTHGKSAPRPRATRSR